MSHRSRSTEVGHQGLGCMGIFSQLQLSEEIARGNAHILARELRLKLGANETFNPQLFPSHKKSGSFVTVAPPELSMAACMDTSHLREYCCWRECICESLRVVLHPIAGASAFASL
jgi:hypothetical protein